jgi:hypothetical protein
MWQLPVTESLRAPARREFRVTRIFVAMMAVGVFLLLAGLFMLLSI